MQSFIKVCILMIDGIDLDLYLLKSSSAGASDGKPCSLSDGSNQASDLASVVDYRGT